MIDITQADVNAFLLGVAKGCGIGLWLIVVAALAWSSVADASMDERESSRLYLTILITITLCIVGIVWYAGLPATRGAQ